MMEQPISSLNLTPTMYENLKSVGYNHLNELPDDEIRKKFGQEEWEYLTDTPKTQNALDLFQEQALIGTIYTFNKNLDAAFEGELLPGRIIELCGKPGSGKTQICFQLCVNVQLNELCGGVAGEAVYVCTNYNFSKRRLTEMATELITKVNNLKLGDLSLDDVLKNIHYFKIVSYEEMVSTVVYLKEWLDNHKVRLLVIDSLTVIVQQIDTKDRCHFTYKLFSDLQALAAKHKFVIILTNNITIRVNSSRVVYNTPALGENCYHRINTRILLKRLCEGTFSATVVKSVLKPTITIKFEL